jgi:NADP-dependent 3-hydroxy acid dehydrogenase YdfG
MITQALITNGAKVYITGRRQEVLESTVKTYNTGPGSLHALPGDISTKEGAIQLAKDLSAKESNGIHLLVNNAGIARDDNTKFCMYNAVSTKDIRRNVFLTYLSGQRTARSYRRRRHQQALPALRRLPMGRHL